MAHPSELDLTLGWFRWAWRRWPHHFVAAAGVTTAIVASAVVGAFVQLPPHPTAVDRWIGAGEAAGIVLGAVVVFGLVVALAIAPREQRNEERRRRQDKQMLNAGVVVVGAIYGARHHGWADVTLDVRQRVLGGQLDIEVNNGTFAANDPAVGWGKTLVIYYVLDGEARQASFQESHRAVLP